MSRSLHVTCAATAIGIALVAAGVFAQKLAWAAFIRDHALMTFRQVLLLDKHGRQLPREPQEILRNELAFSLYNLDEALQSPWNVLLDKQTVVFARNRALAYLSVFPPPLGIEQGVEKVHTVFAPYHVATSPEDERLLRDALIAEKRIRLILQSFDPASLDPDNRVFCTSLSQTEPR